MSETAKTMIAMLQKNNCSSTGTKEYLAEKIAISKVLGPTPENCPKCGGQNLRFSLVDGNYYCPGYLDDV